MLVAARLIAPGDVQIEDAPLRWVADVERCPSADEVRATVEELAGRWPYRHELEVDAFVREEIDAWTMVLTVVVSGRVHRQQLEAESCSALARAAALIVAVSIDPVTSASEVPVALDDKEPFNPREPETDPDRAASDDRGPAQNERTSPRRRARPVVGAGWGVVTGMTPGVSSAPTLTAGLDFSRAYLGLTGRFVLPRAADGARVFGGTVGARGCLASRPQAVRGVLCGGLETGALQARGTGAGGRTQRYPWLAGIVGAGMRWWFADRVALTADLEGAVAVFDAQVVLGRVDVPQPQIVFENPRIGLRAGLGFEIRFSSQR